jgi:hypothetical protein
MTDFHKYSVTLKDGHVLVIEAEAHNQRMIPGWIVFTRNGKGWQAVAVHAIQTGPLELEDECSNTAMNATLAEMLLKEHDAPRGR